ncbi:MAG TPA: ThuA domain-containing protein [Candidatus Atribacteria bacterium]|nr:ThuA domain-containing protein [Candidatus Atribacteria bacterium]HPT78297.1 ThuA domain-containing protein [Candidatus Atribacteria bacterium]
MIIPVLCNDIWHPGEVVKKGLSSLESSDIRFEYIEDAADFSPDIFKGSKLVILSKENNVNAENEAPWMTDEIQDMFKDFVDKGGSLLVIHSGTADYEEQWTLRRLLGGVFDHHPEQCPVTAKMDPDHFMTQGCSDFTVMDEHYFMDMNDDSIECFMTTHSDHGSQPAGWIKRSGLGKVCVITPGHNLEVWLEPSFQRLLRNAVDWCLQSD